MANIQNNQILYTASSKLTETTATGSGGLHTNAFNVSITSHTFSNGNGVIEFDGTLTTIGSQAFYFCNDTVSGGVALTSVTIPNSVTSIGNEAFEGCKNLASITIPNSVTSIGNKAFSFCTLLTSITIPNSVTSIGKDAFNDCNSLTSVIIENGESILAFSTAANSRPFTSCPLETLYMGRNISYSYSSYTPFMGQTALESVTISNYVTSIGANLFKDCTSLATVNIPNSVTSIGDNAFQGCTSLPVIDNIRYADTYLICFTQKSSTYTLKEGTKWIGKSAFNGCNTLKSITIPDSVTRIDDSAFSNCTSLASVTIGNGVTSIPTKAFEGCKNLASITIPNSVTSIGDNAFKGCTSLPVIDNIRYADTYLVEAVDKTLTTYTIKSGTKWIGNSYFNGNASFQDCTNLISITIPDSVVSIGGYAFDGCITLTSITIPDSVTSLGEHAFGQCYELASVTIGNGVTAIPDGCFTYCTYALTSITIPNTVTSIGKEAFRACYNLTSVNIPNSVTRIEDKVFMSTGLTSITIPDSVTYIGWESFAGCTSLTSIIIPNSVTDINNDAFENCNGMLYYRFKSTTPPIIGTGVFANDSGCDIYVPEESVTAYKTATNWTTWESRIKAYNPYIQFADPQVPAILNNHGVGSDGKVTYEQAEAVTDIGTWFRETNITSFDELQYFTGLTSIGINAFSGCDDLTSITIPSSVETIGTNAFNGCSILASISVDVNNQTYDSRNNCNAIIQTSTNTLIVGCKNTAIPNTVTSIGANAFYGCIGRTSITIPNSVTTIGNSAFYGCTGMEAYYFDPTTPPTIGTDVFASDSGCYIFVPTESVTAYKTATNWTTWEDRIFSNVPTTPKPTITPNSGLYFGNNVTVSISSTAISGTTYYTTDGTTPTTGSTQYTAPFQITTSGTTVVKAISYSDYYTNKTSAVETRTYELYNNAVKVEIDPSTQTITSVEEHVDLPVTINATGYTGNYIEIYYTIDGTTPTTNSTRYTGTFTLGLNKSQQKTVKALAVTSYSGTTYTDTDEATYLLKNRTPKPNILPPSGDYHEGFILDVTYPNGSDMYYTLDGSTPTSGSTKYTEQIYINSNTVLKAIAYYAGSDIPDSEVVQRNYTFSDPAKSHKAPRNEDNFNGIYVKDVDYSGATPSILDEADVTWGYRIDNADENLGEYGTRCHVKDTSILIHIDFTHGGKDYSLDKEIPVTCIVQDAQYMADILDLIQGSAIVTLNNTLDISIRAKVTHTSESQTSSIVDLSNFTLSGTSTNGNFTCSKEGSYFVYDGTLTNDYKGSTHPANDITLTLINNNTQQQLSTLVIPVTFQAGSIFDVKDDAIRMAVASSKTYTDSGITYVNNRITDVEVNISGLTSTVSSITTNLSGVTSDVSQIEQRCDRIETNVTNMSGDMVTHSEIIQVATGITASVYNELNERTGIDIYNGTITLDADYTYITGNLMLSGATDGISFSDASGNTKISLSTSLLPNLEQFDMGAITRKRGGATQQIDTIQQSITTSYTDVQLGQYSKGQTIQIDYIVFKAYFIDAPFDERLDTMTYTISIKQNSTVIGTHSGSCTRVYEGVDEFTTGLMSTTATGDGDVTIDMSITCTNKSTAEPKTGRWQTSYNILYQKVEVNQTTIRLNGLATFQDTTHYAWLGPDQTAFRQGESTLRLKNGRIERTPISSEGGITSSNFADVSTVVPFRIVNVLTYSASTQNDGLIIFSTVLGETDSAQRTLYLGDPSECQGKILYVKNVVGSNTKVVMSSDAYRQDLLIPCNSASEVNEISIGANSSMFISDGSDWIQFHCA